MVRRTHFQRNNIMLNQSKRLTKYAEVPLLLEGPKKWWEDGTVLLAYNVPKISARVEKLMDTNIINATDATYMTKFRRRIEEDYQFELQKRFKIRYMKELKRIENLIIKGKSSEIPNQLSDHPIIVANQTVDKITENRRKTFKSNHERNTAVQIKKGIKFERERENYGKSQIEQLINIHKRNKLHRLLERQYIQEDAVRGDDLLRIENENWQDCEHDLRDFLHNTNQIYKKRSKMIPTRHIFDEKDIEYEKKPVRDLAKDDKRSLRGLSLKKASVNDIKKSIYGISTYRDSAKSFLTKYGSAGETVKDSLLSSTNYETKSHISSDDSIFSRSTKSTDMSNFIGSSDSDEFLSENTVEIETTTSNSFDYIRTVEKLEEDTRNGLIMSKEEYAENYYQNPHIAKLRNVHSLTTLYRLGEKIILDTVVDQGESAFGIEEQQNEEENTESMSDSMTTESNSAVAVSQKNTEN